MLTHKDLIYMPLFLGVFGREEGGHSEWIAIRKRRRIPLWVDYDDRRPFEHSDEDELERILDGAYLDPRRGENVTDGFLSEFALTDLPDPAQWNELVRKRRLREGGPAVPPLREHELKPEPEPEPEPPPKRERQRLQTAEVATLAEIEAELERRRSWRRYRREK